MSGVDPGFSEGGGGANGNAWCMAVAAGRVPLKLFTDFIFLWHLHLFITARFLLACQCIQGASNLDAFVSGGGHLMITA